MRQQVTANLKGSNFKNETLPWLAEYSARKLFAQLGYRDSLDDLDAQTADVFILIDNYIQEYEKREHGRRKPKHNR